MTHFDRLDVVPSLGAMWPGAMVRCHCWVGGLAVPPDRVPLLGAMVRCHGKVPLLGAMVRCHYWAPLLGGPGW